MAMIKKTKQKRFLLNCYFITIILYFLVLKVNHSFNKIIHLYTCLCYLHTVVCQTSYSNSIFQGLIPAKIDLSHISFWKTMTVEVRVNIHTENVWKCWPDLTLVQLFVHTGVECRKGLSDLISTRMKELGHTNGYLKLRM